MIKGDLRLPRIPTILLDIVVVDNQKGKLIAETAKTGSHETLAWG